MATRKKFIEQLAKSAMVTGQEKKDMKGLEKPVKYGEEQSRVDVSGKKNKNIVVKTAENVKLLEKNVMTAGHQRNVMSLQAMTAFAGEETVEEVKEANLCQPPLLFQELQFLPDGLQAKIVVIEEEEIV
jgi:hypothetical protein